MVLGRYLVFEYFEPHPQRPKYLQIEDLGSKTLLFEVFVNPKSLECEVFRLIHVHG